MRGTKLMFLSILLLITMACIDSESSDSIAEFTVNKEFNFGTIKVGDTINAVFKIENHSKMNLKIANIKVTCCCLSPVFYDSLIKQNKNKLLNFQYIAQVEDIGNVSLPIVLETNTTPIFNVLKITGKVVN